MSPHGGTVAHPANADATVAAVAVAGRPMTAHRMGGRPGRTGHDPITVWLALVAVSFVAGAAALRFVPSLSGWTVAIGTATNIGLAIGMGVSLGRCDRPRRLTWATVLGSVVTILGTDLLLLAVPGASDGDAAGFLVVFGAIGLVVAQFGMTLLLLLGTAIAEVVDDLRSPS